MSNNIGYNRDRKWKSPSTRTTIRDSPVLISNCQNFSIRLPAEVAVRRELVLKRKRKLLASANAC